MSEAELRTFFDGYGAAFTHTASDIAAFYHAPCMTARQGVVRWNATQRDVTAFFDAVLQQYQAQGITRGDLKHFSSMALDINSSVVTITWHYKNAAGDVLWEGTFTYNLYRGADGWKILLQTLHDVT